MTDADGRALDVLTQALNHLRPKLDRAIPVAERAKNFWGIVVAVRDLAAADVLHKDLKLFARHEGLTADLGRRGEETVEHLIRWGLLNRQPFGRGRGAA